MNKFLKRSVIIALCAGFAFSVIALSACSEKDLIDGNFRTEATAEQLAEVKELVSEENAENIIGDTQSEGWSYNARFVSNGSIDFDINVTAEDKTADITTSVDLDTDHTMSLSNKEGALDARGSGKVDYASAFSAKGLSEKDVKYEQSYKGQSYSDMRNFYIDGTVKQVTENSEYSQTSKIKLELTDAFEQFFPANENGEVFINLDVIRSMFDEEGVKVYIDDSVDFKVKISLDVNAWLDMFAEELSETISQMGGVTIDKEDMLENCKFKHVDYFLQFDKETKLLSGYGSKFDISFNINFELNNVAADIGFDMNLNSWMVKTDTPAAELPEDLDSYQSIIG